MFKEKSIKRDYTNKNIIREKYKGGELTVFAQNKVVKLENESMKIYNVIQSYFKDLNKRNRDYEDVKATNKTQKAYETDIRLFFYLLRGKEKGKELEYLTIQDITITQEDFEEYIDLLCDLKNDDGSNKYVNKTVNRKTTSLKGFIKFLKKKKLIDIDISYLELIKGQKEKKNHYGVLESHEVLEFSRLAYEEKFNGKIKRLLILTAFKTGLRIAELLNLKWSDFQVKENEVLVNGVGKGNKNFSMPITKQFYEDEILTLNEGQEKVFNIGERRIGDMIQRFCDQMGIDKSRNVVFHSIRKAAGFMVYQSSDIDSARRFLRHSSILTTQIYLGVTDHQLHHTVLNFDNIDKDLFRKVEQNILIEAIENLPDNLRSAINVKIQEILNKNK